MIVVFLIILTYFFAMTGSLCHCLFGVHFDGEEIAGCFANCIIICVRACVCVCTRIDEDLFEFFFPFSGCQYVVFSL